MNIEFLGFLFHFENGRWRQDPPLLCELVFWLAVLILFIFLWVAGPERPLSGFLRLLRRLARHPRWAVAGVFVGCIVARLAFLPWIHLPDPYVHDEFSYLLQVKTFAAGRLTNPTPPMWIHYETFHVNFLPTYQSMYQPGMALLLVPFEWLFHQPWIGVLLITAAMCAAVTWMLQALMPREWALLGGIFAIARFGIFSYWMNSFLGGGITGLGGALVLGSYFRITRQDKPKLSYSAAFAVGCLLLAFSRPYEGFVLALIPGILLLVHWIKWLRANSTVALRWAAPGVVILVLGLAWLGYYNWRGTGHATRMPYVVNEVQYHISSPFFWQKPRPIPIYHHNNMRHFYVVWELPSTLMWPHWWGARELLNQKFEHIYMTYGWPVLLVMLPTWVWLLRHRKYRLVGVVVLVGLAALLIETWPFESHYASGWVSAILAIWIMVVRSVRVMSFRGVRFGRHLAMSMLLALAGWTGYRAAYTCFDPWGFIGGKQLYLHEAVERQRIVSILNSKPGKQLLFVHIHEAYHGALDWVYNDPDIENSKVVWARDMGTQGNEELVRHFPDRQVWYVDMNDGISAVVPYEDRDGVALVARQVAASTPRVVPRKVSQPLVTR